MTWTFIILLPHSSEHPEHSGRLWMENFSFRGFVVPVCPGGGHFHYCIVSSTRQQHKWKNRTVCFFFWRKDENNKKDEGFKWQNISAWKYMISWTPEHIKIHLANGKTSRHYVISHSIFQEVPEISTTKKRKKRFSKLSSSSLCAQLWKLRYDFRTFQAYRASFAEISEMSFLGKFTGSAPVRRWRTLRKLSWKVRSGRISWVLVLAQVV